jgi:imidazolonepropionase-like amidohydrolase
MRTRTLAAPVLALALAACAAPAPGPAPAPPPEGSFAVVDVRLFDGERTHPRATVLVRDGRIAAVGEGLRVPPGVPRVDGRGATLLPGMIDAHVHAYGEEALEQAMRFGVTTVIDLFGEPRRAEAIRRSQREGAMARVADLRSAGYVATAPGGHGTQYGMPVPTLTRPEEAEGWVRARLGEGSDLIKIIYEDGSGDGMSIPTLDRPTLAALVAAARRHGAVSIVHVGSRAGAADAIAAGADGLAHLFYDRQIGADLAARAAEAGMFVVPTLTVLESATVGPSGVPLLKVPQLAAYLGAREEAELRATFRVRPGGEARFASALEAVAALRAAGVPLLAGSDAPNPGTSQGVSMHRELELLVRAGLTPAEALRAATSAPADAFRLADRGRVAPGLRADLLLVRGDPTAGVTATRDIVHVWKAGIPADREGARERIAREREER